MGQLEEGAVEPREEGGPRRKKAKTVVGSDVVGGMREGCHLREGRKQLVTENRRKRRYGRWLPFQLLATAS